MEKMIENKKSMYIFDVEKGNVIGVDEAGRGPLAGPVIAVATKIKKYKEELNQIDDSKKLSEKKREKLYETINECFYIGIGEASVAEIDDINILNATFLAMRRAINSLEKQINIDGNKVIVDGNHKIRGYDGEQECIIKGDSKSLTIAASSIVAKVTRDRMMKNLAKLYPNYSFEKHKGYGTKLHREAILKNGASDIHRKSFLKKILGE